MFHVNSKCMCPCGGAKMDARAGPTVVNCTNVAEGNDDAGAMMVARTTDRKELAVENSDWSAQRLRNAHA